MSLVLGTPGHQPVFLSITLHTRYVLIHYNDDRRLSQRKVERLSLQSILVPLLVDHSVVLHKLLFKSASNKAKPIMLRSRHIDVSTVQHSYVGMHLMLTTDAIFSGVQKTVRSPIPSTVDFPARAEHI